MRFKGLIAVFAVVLFALPETADAQLFRGTHHWKSLRKEYGIGTGASNFLGELGGRDRVGSDLFYDLEFSQTHTATQLFYRYYVSQKTALRATMSYGIVRGDDKTTAEQFRRNRNLNFRSPIIELGAVYEVHLLQEVVGHRYAIKGAKGFRNAFIDMYVYAGLTGFYFNPKGRIGNQWHALQPLGTEGQGLVGAKKPYSRINMSIPIGFGFNKMLGKGPGKGAWKVGIDFSVHKTFTDYLDDASTTYYDNDLLRQERGDVAAQLADPSLGNIEGATRAGLQRGDPTDMDSYIFALVTVTRKVSKRPNFRRRVRSRRSMPSF